MLQDDIQRVREQYARYNGGERAPGRWFWHEDAEYHTAREDPDHAAHRGIDAIGKLFASWLEAYPDLRLEIQEAEALGDKVFLWIRFAGHGAASGIPLEMELAHLLTLRDGKGASVVEYTDRKKPSKPWDCRTDAPSPPAPLSPEG
jgi:ketosteroid isomerase-like protein